ncbi:alpha/beta hydrolase [Allorhizocola rhizosphaerae]|uniref:alpha/beta hydrolase n=1 Tax=Allorhizocola rhizosphaerae TaxID=1872709 RepID=UPI000E3D1D1D|nr:alpha/beta hydrolase [Allorhizocola rhizosphaerae]
MGYKAVLYAMTVALLFGCAPVRAQSELGWAPCDHIFECTKITAPLSHRQPDGPVIQLAVKRLPARGEAIGTLVFGVGGPGDAGTDHIRRHASGLEPLRARYHIVGFDYRGLGNSTRVHCLSPRELDDYYSSELIGREAHAATTRFVDACAANSGPFLSFVGTDNIARDLETLRVALGEDRLNYFGFSYGTRVGLTYAELYPDRVGHMVLDSIDNPVAAPNIDVGDQPPARTPNEDNVARVADPARVDALLASLQAQPRRAGDGRIVNATVARTALFQATKPPLKPFPVDDIDAIQILADKHNGRERDGTYDHNKAIYVAVTCLTGDPDAGVPDRAKALERIDRVAAKAAASAPYFGAWLTYRSSLCEIWPAAPTFRPHRVRAPGIGPILLLNNSGDRITTAQEAKEVEQELDNAVLVVRKSDEHGAFMRGDRCVDTIVIEYLFNNRLPKEDTRC